MHLGHAVDPPRACGKSPLTELNSVAVIPMKKRVRTPPKYTDRLSLMTGASLPRAVRSEPAPPAENVPGLAIVPGPQFTELLAMLERPPEVPVELRREVANRRWK